MYYISLKSGFTFLHPRENASISTTSASAAAESAVAEVVVAAEASVAEELLRLWCQ